MKSSSRILAVLLCWSLAQAALDAEPTVATVCSVSGSALVTGPSGESKKIVIGDRIVPGSSIHTDDGSTVGLELLLGAVTSIAPNTDLTLTTLDYSQPADGPKSRTIRIDLKTGNLSSSLVKNDGNSKFFIYTPDGLIKVIGTVFNVAFSHNSGVSVKTVNGVVELTLPGGQVISVPGGTYVLSKTGTRTLTGTLTAAQLTTIKNALMGSGFVAGQHGTYTKSTNPKNPQNISIQQAVSPN